MTNLNVFIDGTKDPIEILYGSTVTTLFPNYAEFWCNYVGNPKFRVPKSYGLLYKSSVSETERKRRNDIYQEICMVHYSLFCHLAGAHFQIDNLRKIKKTTKSWKKKYFEYWEAFEVGYFHLGSTFYQMYHLWGLYFLFRRYVTRNPNGRFNQGIKSLLKKYLIYYGEKNTLLKEMEELDDSVRIIRNNIVHFSRDASDFINKEFLIPAELEKNLWSKKHKEKEWLDTFKLITEHLSRTEKMIDSIHLYLIVELIDYFIKEGIAVNY